MTRHQVRNSPGHISAASKSAMKTTGADRSKAVFRNPPPGLSEDDFVRLLGRAFTRFERVCLWLRTVHPNVTVDERFSAQSGWHRIYVLKKRRLFYLVPKSRDFRFSMILGDKALALHAHGEFASRIKVLLKDAKRYPEGTAFIFDRKSFDPEIVIALLKAKLAR
jgi:hypothetical protein